LNLVILEKDVHSKESDGFINNIILFIFRTLWSGSVWELGKATARLNVQIIKAGMKGLKQNKKAVHSLIYHF
jgi:hypothetical protein